MFEAVFTISFFTAAGKPQPTGPCQSKFLMIASIVSITAFGVAGLGVGIRYLSVTSSPLFVSTIAPFIPDPPTSIPNIFIVDYSKDDSKLEESINVTQSVEFKLKSKIEDQENKCGLLKRNPIVLTSYNFKKFILSSRDY
jgi:hypothetical protein